MFWLVLIFPGLFCAYFLFLRPALKAIPAFSKFYAEADGFWAKAWALCGKSITVAWGGLLTGLGTVWQYLDALAAAVGDPELKQQAHGCAEKQSVLCRQCADGDFGDHHRGPVALDREGLIGCGWPS
jgi:hypothetical protein